MNEENTADLPSDTCYQEALIYKYSSRGQLDKKIASYKRRGKKKYAYAGLWFGLIIGLFLGTLVYELTMKQPQLVELTINEHKLMVEIAQTDKERQQGLMYRETLADDAGMLFIYPNEQQLTFWMKDTSIPLSIAFIDSDGVIVDIQDMDPFDETYHTSSQAARYALELNQGWFSEHGTAVGDIVQMGGE